MESSKVILKILKDAEALPFLFVGSGITKRYLEAESWEGLLRLFANKTDPSTYYYEKLREEAKSIIISKGLSPDLNSLLFPQIADLIEEKFYKVWYESPNFENSRKKYEREIHDGISPLKLEIAEYCKQLICRTPKLENELKLLKELSAHSIAGIITTNYDCFLEELFPDFTTYIGQGELMFANHLSVSEIYKIHGCCSKPDTIVINSRDYHEFEQKNSYLAAKLLTVFVEHPIIFIGYSLQDENILKILQAIIECFSPDKIDKLKNRLIFVEWEEEQKDMDVSTYAIMNLSKKIHT